VNPSAWNWGNYTGFFWAGLCALCCIYVYFRLPEPSGRSFAEMDLLFERKVSARKFATTHVDVFEEHVDSGLMDQYEHQIEKSNVSHLEKAPHQA
jgi:SP family general alpha glucoside:H+ symporter-like MFS transporter